MDGVGKSLCIDRYVSFDSRHFFTRVITLFTSGIRIFDALSVNNEQTGLWGPQIPLTNFLYEQELDLFQEARTSSKRWLAPDSKIFMNGSPRRTNHLATFATDNHF
jgi:hypothetical protein